MKKFLLAVSVFMAFCLGFAGCGANISSYLKSNISETCTNYYIGKTNDFSVSLFSGEREENYKLDGVSTKLVPFTIISVRNVNNVKFSELQYTLEVDGKTYDGALMQNPYDDVLEADVKISISPQSEVFVYLKFGEITQIANLECVFQNFSISYQTALDIAVDEVIAQKPELKQNLTYECFIQILNKDMQNPMYFWLVNIVSSEGDMFNVIIDTTTGEVLAKKL